MYKENIQAAIDYIEDNLRTEITAAEAAEKAGYSVFHFYRIFQNTVGMPVMQYILRRKLLHAIHEIGSGRKKTDTVLEYGFNEGIDDFDLGGLNLRDYIDSFCLRFVAEFREDGTYSMNLDQDQARDELGKCKEPLCRFFRDIFRMALSQQLSASGFNLDLSDDAALKALTGYTLDELIETSMGMGLEQLVEEQVMGEDIIQSYAQSDMEGFYEAEEDRIYLTPDMNSDFDYSSYETYEFNGDTFVITGAEGNADPDTVFPGLNIYPLTFQREG